MRSNIDPFSVYDDARLWEALKRSYLVEDRDFSPVSSMTEVEGPRAHGRIGLDTVIEPDGANLSVGERSLLSLARALVKDSSIVILDEATYDSIYWVAWSVTDSFYCQSICRSRD